MTNSVPEGKIIADIIINYLNQYMDLFNSKGINLVNIISTITNTFK